MPWIQSQSSEFGFNFCLLLQINSAQQLLELINKLTKVVGHSSNIQKPIILTFLCVNIEISGRESKKKKKSLLKLPPKDNIKYPGKNLTKEVKDLNMENCKTLIKEIEGDSKK